MELTEKIEELENRFYKFKRLEKEQISTQNKINLKLKHL